MMGKCREVIIPWMAFIWVKLGLGRSHKVQLFFKTGYDYISCWNKHPANDKSVQIISAKHPILNQDRAYL